MKRRSFLQTLAAGALAVPNRTFAADEKLDRIGLELYAVRNAMKADPERTMAAVRAIGYTRVELLWSFDNFGRTPQQVRDTLKAQGMDAPSAHMAPETMLTDWEKHLDDARLIGQQYLIVPSLSGNTRSLDTWKMWADRFNQAGATARKADIWLAFHNEPDHMPLIDGQIPYDVFVERTDPSVVRLQLDVGNMTVGKGDPMKYLAKYRERYWSFHLKDTKPDLSRDAELGTGIFDFRKFLADVKGLDKKPYYIEQESPKDELASARRHYEFLRALRF